MTGNFQSSGALNVATSWLSREAAQPSARLRVDRVALQLLAGAGVSTFEAYRTARTLQCRWEDASKGNDSESRASNLPARRLSRVLGPVARKRSRCCARASRRLQMRRYMQTATLV